MMAYRFYALLILLIAMLGFFQYRLWFEAGGIREMLQLKQAIKLRALENDMLKKRNEDLLAQIKRLHASNEMIEARARDELGMIKKGEVFYRIVTGSR